jgi:hypothetical protein
MSGFGGSDESKDTFNRFQNFSYEALSRAANRLNGTSFNEIFEDLQKQFIAANDNPNPIGEEMIDIFLSEPFMSMLACWETCGRDMLKAKLSWTPENSHTWRFTPRG